MVRFLLLFCLCFLGLTADIVVVVSQDSALHSITRQEVRQLFLNNQNGGLQAVELQASPLHDTFYSRVTGKNASQLRAYRARQIFSGRGKPPRRIHAAALEAYLREHPYAITYLDEADVPATLRIIYRLP